MDRLRQWRGAPLNTLRAPRKRTPTGIGDSIPAELSAIVPAPFGALGLREEGGTLREIVFLPPGTSPWAPTSPAGEALATWLQAYFRDPDTPPPTDLEPIGTPFQRRTWEAIGRIPRGQVRRYADLARALGSAPRAVGQACGANPLPLLIPCHRVVSAQGLGGFANAREGFLMDAKRWLLSHEGAL